MAATLAYCACAVAVLFAATADAQSCQAPCVRLAECKWLAEMLRREPRPPGTAQLFKRLVCGRDGYFILVCCESPPDQQPVTSATPRPEWPVWTQEQPTPRPRPTPTPRPGGTQDPAQHPNVRLLPSNVCGYDDSDRITNGNVTAINQFPWMALLAYSARPGDSMVFLCGGALITSRYVLTASHCVNGQKLAPYKVVGVRLGEWDQRTDIDVQGDLTAPRPEDYFVEEAIPHPDYVPQATANVANDIALLRLDRDVALDSSFIRPICLPLAPEMQGSFVGKTLLVAGWGNTEYRQPSPVKLFVGVPVVDEQTCQQRYSRFNRRIVPSQLCAGGVNGQDSCTGDSGGPLMAFQNPKRGQPRGVVIGVVSFGTKECGMEGYPGVYTRVSSFLTWILDTIRP